MSPIDKEMWEDFVVEANENLEELEPNLLLLENDSKNVSLLNDCFRNMHSIKGAAGYMGLERISTLAHAVENLLDKVRQGELELTPEGASLIFQAIDRIRVLMNDVAQSWEEKSETQDLLDQITTYASGGGDLSGPSPRQATDDDQPTDQPIPGELDEDQELLEIFAEEMKSLYGQLEKLGLEEGVSKEAVINILQGMERVTNYIGLDSLLEKIEEIRGRLESDPSEVLDQATVKQILDELADLLKRHIPSLDLGQQEGAPDGPGEEEDTELYEIFLEFVKENCRPLAQIPEKPDEAWLKECQETVDRLRSSAHYMDYPDIVNLFDEWGERLAEALSSPKGPEHFDSGPLTNLWYRLQERLPELNELHFEPQETGPPAQGELTQTLESAIDDLFDSSGFFQEEGVEGVEAGDLLTADALFQTEQTGEGEIETLEATSGPAEGTTAPGAEEFVPTVSQPSEAPTVQSSPETPPTAPKAAPAQTVRIDLEKVEGLLREVGELVVLRSAITQAADEMKSVYKEWLEERIADPKELKKFKDIMIKVGEQSSILGRVVHNLQDGVMKMRMLPVSTLFNRYPRMIRDLSRKLGKQVHLEIQGAETALDKRVIEEMADPLMHIIRNAVDHGIETPDVREKLGKPPVGTLTLSASQEGNFVVITVRDDGKGLDREALIRRAVSLGLIGSQEAQTMRDEKVWEIIFLPGITTAKSVSETSGRGVGMDVVKQNVEKLGGTIQISSLPGKMTELSIRIPLTLAIIPALMVRVGHQVMAVPLATVQETFRIYSNEISSIEGFEIISLRQQTLPLIRLGRIFRGTGAPDNPEKLFVVVIKLGNIEAGLGVDGFLGQQEVVIKPLAEYLTDQPGFSGATILGDGSIALILDIPVLLDRAKGFTLKRQQLMEQATLNMDDLSGTLH